MAFLGALGDLGMLEKYVPGNLDLRFWIPTLKAVTGSTSSRRARTQENVLAKARKQLYMSGSGDNVWIGSNVLEVLQASGIAIPPHPPGKAEDWYIATDKTSLRLDATGLPNPQGNTYVYKISNPRWISSRGSLFDRAGSYFMYNIFPAVAAVVATAGVVLPALAPAAPAVAAAGGAVPIIPSAPGLFAPLTGGAIPTIIPEGITTGGIISAGGTVLKVGEAVKKVLDIKKAADAAKKQATQAIQGSQEAEALAQKAQELEQQAKQLQTQIDQQNMKKYLMIGVIGIVGFGAVYYFSGRRRR